MSTSRMASVTSESSQTYSSLSGSTFDEKLRNQDFSTLEVVKPSSMEYYKRSSQIKRSSFYQNWLPSRQEETANVSSPSDGIGANISSAPPVTGSRSSDEPPPPPPPPPALITICGLPQKAFWIIFGVISGLIALGIIIGGAVGGTMSNKGTSSLASSPSSSSPAATVTAVVTVTMNSSSTTMAPSSTTSDSNSTSSAATTTASSVCVGGTGEGNLSGLCSFACSYGYCPEGSCTCTSSGAPVATPPVTGVDGVPLSNETDAYDGLCSFCCNHDYCPSTACTTANSTTTSA